MTHISRRSFFKLTGAAVATAAADATAAKLGTPRGESARAVYGFFKPEEAQFIETAVQRLIPADDTGPGALEAGVPLFIDKQLAGAWGAGERLFRSGPWHEGSPSQGYQLPFTPAELFRHALRGIEADLARRGGKRFEKLSAQEQDAYLKSLESGDIDLNGVPSKVFFESLLAMTIEGYFSDPVYGGNKDMASWKMIGFPGAYANYYHLVDQHGMQFTGAPVSLADDGRGVIRIHPHIPASDRPQGAGK